MDPWGEDNLGGDQHCDESIAPVCQRKDAKCIEGSSHVGDGGLQDVANGVRRSVILVDAIECVSCGLHRERRYVEGFTVRGDSGGKRRDNEANVGELAEFAHQMIDSLPIISLWV